MKKEIHPQYKKTTIHCACGNTISTRSTKENIQVDICSSCHPFFTGKQKLVDTAGRIDRFKKKYGERVTLGGKKKTAAKETVQEASAEPKPETPAA